MDRKSDTAGSQPRTAFSLAGSAIDLEGSPGRDDSVRTGIFRPVTSWTHSITSITESCETGA